MEIPRHAGETVSLDDIGFQPERGPADPEMQACIDLCVECHRVCTATVTWCLGMGGAHAAAEHIRALVDCAQICATSADFMLRGSDHHASTCGACAVICRACADSCDRLEGDEMKRCAEICLRCADSCLRMSRHAGGH